MERLVGTLSLQQHAPNAAANSPDWAGYVVRLFYTARLFNEPRLVEKAASVYASGRYEFLLSGNERDDPQARVAAYAPSGQVLGAQTLSKLLNDDGTLKPLELERPSTPFDITPVALAAQSSVRVSGRVFSVSGVSGTAGKSIRLFGRLPGASAFTPLWAGSTDRNGYFSGDAIRLGDRLGSAVALVGEKSDQQRLDVPLDDQGGLPIPILLFLHGTAVNGTATADCACDTAPAATPDADELAENGASFSSDLGAGCPNFTMPNRTLEEFDYYKIARTSDPDIQGLTLPESDPGARVSPALTKVVFDRGSLAQATEVTAAPALNTPATMRRASVGSGRALTELSAALGTFRDTTVSQSNSTAFTSNLSDYINVAPLAASGARTAANWRLATDDAAAATALRQAVEKIPAAALRAALEDPDGFTPDRMMTLERRASAEALSAYLNWRHKTVSGRAALNEDNSIDWDDTPHFYQAVSIAHGHLLHFKQVWKADGYSLGSLVKSIPLAPGQKKQIAVIDWDRSDTAARAEQTTETEALQANLSHDRDINEIANAAFNESLRGGSDATTGAVGGGLGLAIGPLVIGGGGGSSWASSNAWSDNARSFSSQTLNDLRDQTSQAASAVRNQRSTVVQTVYQRERVGVSTEVIANHNRCHALTIQYFEVLRHFAVYEMLADVRECLFVPLQMTVFDDAKVLRWFDLLRQACRRRDLLAGFESIKRLNTPTLVPPNRRFADDPIEEMSGRITLRVAIARPKDPDDAARAALEQTDWGFLGAILHVSPETIYERYRRNDAERDLIFRTEIAPDVAREFLESLSVYLVDSDGFEHDAGLDLTVASRYEENGLMQVDLNDNGQGPRLTRAQVTGVLIRSSHELPAFSKVIVESATMSYRTERIDGQLYQNDRVFDDVSDDDPAYLSTATLTWLESRNQLTEDRARRRRLLRHLNNQIEYFHRAIWLGMDANRRYMLLDGFEAPAAGGRSVASVVDNRLLGIVGNCLVMPVAPGFVLDPLLQQAIKDAQSNPDGGQTEPPDPQLVLDRLYHIEPAPPRRHSVPTRGVFAEAMQSTCKSCELIEEDRFWRWKDYPLPDSPPPIQPVSTDSRAASLGNLTPTPFPGALVNFQAVPSAPDPTGMAAALDLLGKDVFKDLTGLTQNQRNAMAAFTTALTSSQSFAGEAFKLAMAQDAARNLDRTLGQIESAKNAGYLDTNQASAAARDALTRAIAGDGSPSGQSLTDVPEISQALDRAGSDPTGSATVTRGDGDNQESVTFQSAESDLAIGKAPSAIARDYPVEIWLDVPLIKDQLTAALDYEDSARADRIDLARYLGVIIANINGQTVFIDVVQSALDSGFLRPNPADASKFQIKVAATICYPADPKDNSKVVKPKAGKYPFVAMVHGNSTAWEFNPPVKDTGRTLSLLPLVTGAVSDRKDYEGYKYLQTALAQLPQPIVSISFSHAFPNMVDSHVELRSEMLLEALRKVITDTASPGALLADVVDFQNTGLMGHSRGGETVVRAYSSQKTKAVPGLRLRAVCSIAPTDWRGASNTDKLSMPAEPDANYFVLYGALDGDVNGLRFAGVPDTGGTGFRLYDRSSGAKTMAMVRKAIHDRFNQKWPETVEWPGGVPSGALARADQEKVAIQLVGGFFDLILNNNAKKQPLFRNESALSPVQEVAFQWSFGSQQLQIDEFSGAAAQTGNRVTGPGSDLPKFAPLTPPALSVDRSLEMRVPHDDIAYRITQASVGAATHTLSYDLGSIDVSAFDRLTLRLGLLYPIADQAAIDAASLPKFKLLLEDTAGNKGSLDSSTLVPNMKNGGWVRPMKKTIAGNECTLMFLQTLQASRGQLQKSATPNVDLTKLKSLAFEFDTSAGTPDEIWLDSITFMRN